LLLVSAPQVMPHRRAVLQIPAKSSAPPRLPFHKNRSLLTPSQSTLSQLLIPLHFNSFRNNVYKKPGGRGPAANPKVGQLVTRHAARLRTRRNSRNPNPLICLLHNSRTPGVGVPGQGYKRTPRRRHLLIERHFFSRSSLFSVCSVPGACPDSVGALKSPFHQAATSAGTRKPIPATSPLSLFTTHDPLLTRSSSFQGKIYPTNSRSHHV